MLKPILATLAIAAGIAATTLTTCTSAGATDDNPITFTYGGDSITARDDSWLYQLNDDGLQSVGGTAISGKTSAEILAASTPHSDADVLVVELGTNDVTQQVPESTVASNIVALANKVQAKHVLILALPPSNIEDDSRTHVNRRAAGVTQNRTLIDMAVTHNYLYVDPFSFQRAYNNAWGTNASVDGVHPTTVTNTRVASRMRVYIRQAASLPTS
jgi:lysophospholipase L1-like esterase